MLPGARAFIPRGLEVQFALAKTGKYASSESGDTVEMVERPNGGLSLVLADGQRSGRAAKLISNIAARKIVSLLADGVRDGAAARAAHDYLRTLRQGQVSAEVSIASVDLVSGTLVISRNTQCPALIFETSPAGIEVRRLDEPSEPMGIHAGTKPVISEMPVQAGLYAVLFSDGILVAGSRRGLVFDVAEYTQGLLARYGADAQRLADDILGRALELDEGRPADDTSVAVLTITPDGAGPQIRRMCARFPV